MMNHRVENNYYQPETIGVSLLSLLALIFLGTLIASLIVQVLGQFLALDYTETINSLSENTSITQKNFVRIALCIGQAFTFLLPAFLFLKITNGKNWLRFLKMDKLSHLNFLLLASLLLIISFPLVQFIFSINKQIPFPTWIISQEDTINNTIKHLLHVQYPYELLFNIFAIAILPAVGEEWIFRGIIQQYLQKVLNNPHLVIWITALIFSFVHFQFQGFLPRTLLGVSLGYIFWWTQNLWPCIIAHFCFNALQVLLQFLNQKNIFSINLNNIEQVPVSWAFVSLIGMSIISFALWKIKKYRGI